MVERADGSREAGWGRFSATCLKTVNNQLCALLNHAVRFYTSHRARVAGPRAKSADEIRFCPKGLRLPDELMGKPFSSHAFETLYWYDVRDGELLPEAAGGSASSEAPSPTLRPTSVPAGRTFSPTKNPKWKRL